MITQLQLIIIIIIIIIIITKSTGRSTWKLVAKWKSIITGRDRPLCSCVKMAINRQTFTVGYLQFVDRNHLRAVQSFKLAISLTRQLSMNSIARVLQIGSV